VLAQDQGTVCHPTMGL